MHAAVGQHGAMLEHLSGKIAEHDDALTECANAVEIHDDRLNNLEITSSANHAEINAIESAQKQLGKNF